MPLFKDLHPGNGVRALIWKAEEPEDFFSEKTGLRSDKKLPIRRIEHLAGRFLLQQLAPDIPLSALEISPLGKPYFPGGPWFSVSHSFPYIGAAISSDKEVGIDVQILQGKILRLQDKFLSPEEQTLCLNEPGRITLAWTAKEAAFKMYGLGAVDFIGHMPIRSLDVQGTEATMLMEFSRETPSRMLSLHGGLEPDFAWSVTR